jgi:hypothetical protein
MEDDQEQVWKSLDTWTVRYPLAMPSNFAKAQPPVNRQTRRQFNLNHRSALAA